MIDFSLVVFPVDRASEWEWVAGSNSPELSLTGQTPATHKWFSLQPTQSENTRIDNTLTAEDTRLTVDLDTQSPVAVIQSATGLTPLTPDD